MLQMRQLAIVFLTLLAAPRFANAAQPQKLLQEIEAKCSAKVLGLEQAIFSLSETANKQLDPNEKTVLQQNLVRIDLEKTKCMEQIIYGRLDPQMKIAGNEYAIGAVFQEFEAADIVLRKHFPDLRMNKCGVKLSGDVAAAPDVNFAGLWDLSSPCMKRAYIEVQDGILTESAVSEFTSANGTALVAQMSKPDVTLKEAFDALNAQNQKDFEQAFQPPAVAQ